MNPILVAIDTPDMQKGLALASKLAGVVGGIKLGLEFFSAQGHAGVKSFAELGLPIFLDLKFHDIPNTVAGAVRSVLPLSPFILNVHAQGGLNMMIEAKKAVLDCARPPLLIAVTVLTSLNQAKLNACGVPGKVEDQVLRLAGLAQEAGLDGVVCSGEEIAALRRQCGPDFKLIVPGIRPVWAAVNDQERVKTPKEAVKEGANWLVIGRPITGADDPALAAQRILDEL